jgi:uncharacterized membrane protein YfcA
MDGPIFVIALGAIAAGFVQGLSGFAFSLVAMSFWAWSVEPMLAAVLAVFGGLSGQILAAFSVRRGFDFKRLLPFLIGGLIGIPLGTMLLPKLDIVLFKAVLGALLVVWCPFMLFARHLPKITMGGRAVDGVVGLIGGVCGGLGGFSGALPTLWCTLRGMEKDAQRSIIQTFNLAMLGTTMLSYVIAGMVTREMLPMFGVVLPAMLIPALIGARIYIGISEATFRNIVLSLLTASGVALLASSLPTIVGRM